MFVYLPSGEIVNTDQITRIVPLASGFTRVFYVSGEQIDYPEDYTDLLRKAVTGMPTGSAKRQIPKGSPNSSPKGSSKT
jgi:hypothetical protein